MTNTIKVGIIGTGYVGLISSVCFADIGHEVVSFDTNQSIIASLKEGKTTIYEEHLEQKLQKNLQNNRLLFTNDPSPLKDCEIILISVGTPPLPNGDADLTQVKSTVQNIVPIIDPSTLLTIRSTVPVGTVSEIQTLLDSMGKEEQLLGFCPEFLREGVGIQDLLHPYLLVFASKNEQGLELMQKMYQPIIDTNSDTLTLIRTHSFETAELIKYAINSFLATKITYMNQIAQFAQKTDANIHQIIEAMSSDWRINGEFLKPGPGFGGSCFPKDTLALVQRGLDYHVNLSLIREVSNANHNHKNYIATWIVKTLLSKYSKQNYKKVGMWGLSFKANTDDVRESASLNIIQHLLEENFTVTAHDPQGMQNFQHALIHTNLSYEEDALLLASKVDVLIILTEWEEYKHYTSEHIAERFADTIVFDTRGICEQAVFDRADIPLYKFGL